MGLDIHIHINGRLHNRDDRQEFLLEAPEAIVRAKLRELHLEMDRTVLAAYGWADLPVPPFTDPVTDAEKAARQAFEDEVLDRLFALNAERHRHPWPSTRCRISTPNHLDSPSASRSRIPRGPSHRRRCPGPPVVDVAVVARHHSMRRASTR